VNLANNHVLDFGVAGLLERSRDKVREPAETRR
jgi:hypothetical protein